MLYPISEAVTLQKARPEWNRTPYLNLNILQLVLQLAFINPEWKKHINLLYSIYDAPEYAFSAHFEGSWVFSSVTAWEGT